MHLLRFRPEAYEDIDSAYSWYERQRKGLGEEFLLVLEDSFAKIAKDPNIYPKVYNNIQRKLIKRFPYGVFYTLKTDMVIIVAILHTRSDTTKRNIEIA